jgi:hypothetical protein
MGFSIPIEAQCSIIPSLHDSSEKRENNGNPLSSLFFCSCDELGQLAYPFFRFAISSALSSLRNTFPTVLLGSSVRNSISEGSL